MESKKQKEINWDNIFKKELKDICKQIKKIKASKLSQQEQIQKYTNIAWSFYDRFKDSPIPLRQPDKTLEIQPQAISTFVLMHYGCLKVPFFFVEVFEEDLSMDFEEIFTQNLKWTELIGMLQQTWLEKRKKLTRTMVLLVKTLSRYGTTGQIYRFPLTSEMMANRTRQSLSIIKKTFFSLYTSNIARDFFLINPWKIGWELYLLSYNMSYNDSFKKYELFTIAFEILANSKVFRVIQQPMLKDSTEMNEIKQIMKKVKGEIYSINSLDFHWELSQLEPREDESFLIPPKYFVHPINEIDPVVHFEYTADSLDWVGQVSAPTGDGKFSHRRKEQIMAVLNYLVEYGIPVVNYDTTAQKIGLSTRDFSNSLHFLIENNIITLSHRFKFIGAGSEYAFLITKSTAEINHNVKQALFQCVFSYLYESDNAIAGRLQVPDTWVPKLFKYFTLLQLRHPELDLSYGERLLGFSMFLPNVRLPTNYVLNDFGTKKEITVFSS